MAIVNGTPGFTQQGPTNVLGTLLVNGNPIGQEATQSIEVLTGFSTDTQAPTGTNTPLQVEFGAAQGGASDPAELSAAGAITINEAGNYELIILLTTDRTGPSGVAELWGRVLVNGTQIGLSVNAELDNAASGGTEQFDFIFSGTNSLAEGDVVTVEVYRDSTGADDGQLVSKSSSIGWNPVPSAAFRLYQRQVENP